MIKIKPFKNRILLKYLDNPKTTKGGLIIPDTVSKTDILGFTNKGEIIAIGGDVDKKEFKIGDIVFFRRTDPINVKLGGKDTEDGREIKYLLIKDEEILGKIK